MTAPQADQIHKKIVAFLRDYLIVPPAVTIHPLLRVDGAQLGACIQVGSSIYIYECFERSPDARPDYREWYVADLRGGVAVGTDPNGAIRVAVAAHIRTAFDEWVSN